MSIQYHASWAELLKQQFAQPYMTQLSTFLQKERSSFTVFPPEELVFNALQLTPLENVKVVILGQDPYHNIGQAHGLSFSVPRGMALPPSLRNIYKELQNDIEGFKYPEHGDLTRWGQQGVLLLNATLTVRAHHAGSHQNRGWEIFSDAVIAEVSRRLNGVVFILWGAYAQKKDKLIDPSKHLMLKSVHPSPLSAHRGFFGCKHFSQTNDYLKRFGKTPVDWRV